MDPYSIKELINTFDSHDNQYQESQKELIKNWNENNPDEEPPAYLASDFSVARALKLMCQEILALKEKTDSEEPA